MTTVVARIALFFVERLLGYLRNNPQILARVVDEITDAIPTDYDDAVFDSIVPLLTKLGVFAEGPEE